MTLTPDAIVVWRVGPLAINATLVVTWALMVLLVAAAALIGRRLRSEPPFGPGQHVLEILYAFLRDHVRDIARQDPEPYLPFIGTLFVFILTANVAGAVPGVPAPTASIATTAALALAVFLAVPVYGVRRLGLRSYLGGYLHPSPLMLPFNVIGELSRTLALAVRLFGNLLSTSVIVAILLTIVPFLFPAVMNAFGLLIGVIQAYIFTVLAIVYIVSGSERQRRREPGRGKES
jgi:F-type H+-transporting ATPase subunit a